MKFNFLLLFPIYFLPSFLTGVILFIITAALKAVTHLEPSNFIPKGHAISKGTLLYWYVTSFCHLFSSNCEMHLIYFLKFSLVKFSCACLRWPKCFPFVIALFPFCNRIRTGEHHILPKMFCSFFFFFPVMYSEYVLSFVICSAFLQQLLAIVIDFLAFFLTTG